jgi:two-component system, chemotaxis family, protein-glutamate methylesterase/glutaminase
VTPALRAPDPRVIARRVIAISTSAGGLAALRVLLGDLPASLAAAVLVVQHLLPNRDSHLVEILRWHSSLRICESRPALRLWCGTVYVAPPDFHLLVGIDRRLVLSNLPPLNFCRPSSDRMFASLAAVYGRDTVAVVLTGRGRDGAAGAQLVRRMGGHVIVQDPETAEYADMPRAALRAGAVDAVLPLGDIAGALRSLIAPPLITPPLVSPRVLA